MGAWGDVKIVLMNERFRMSVTVSIVIRHCGLVGFQYSVERSGKKDGWTEGERKKEKKKPL